ncbi:MAG: TonB-dependent receptor [Pseudomonadota bacterium]
MTTRHLSRRARKHFLSSAAIAVAFALTGLPATASAQESVRVDIEAQPLGEALGDIGNRFRVTVIAPDALVQGKTTPPISGSLTAEQAIARVLSGSGLTYRRTRNGGFIVQQQTAQAKPVQTPRPARVEETVEPEEPVEMEMIIVTGTNIRGIAPDSSPLRTFNRADVVASGEPTTQDFIRTIPQNFNGGATDRAPGGVPGDSGSFFNRFGEGSFGSSVNLRGLGSGATLVLLNGRRQPLAGGIGDFVDISLIPATAIERVEVLLDGASSVYGADAVAGVTNFILRDEFDGVEASFRFGVPTQGGFEEYRANLVAGHNWGSGSFVASYEFFDQGALDALDRDFSAQFQEPGASSTLIPSQERHSVIVSGRQEIASNLSFDADLLYAERDSSFTAFNPFGDGLTSDPETDTLSIGAGLEWEIDGNWFARFGGTYGRTNTLAERVDPGNGINDLIDISSDLATIDANISGALFTLPGGDVKLAVGGQVRLEDFFSIELNSDSVRRDADREVYAGFAEVFVPIFGTSNALPGIERLEVSASVRVEDYSDFGSTTNPKVGVLWQPVEQVRLRGSYSTSFRAPALGLIGARDLQAIVGSVAFFDGFEPFGFDPSLADRVVLQLFGTGSSIGSETSRTFTAGVDFEQDWGGARLAASVGWFDIAFENRVNEFSLPGLGSISLVPFAFDNPGVLPPGTVVFDASPDEVQAILDTPGLRTFAFGFDPTTADIINFAGVSRNLASTDVSGLDFQLASQFDVLRGQLDIGFNATLLTEFQTVPAPGQETIDVLDTLYNPADFNFRANVGYSTGPIAANVFVNFTDGYRFTADPGSQPVDSITTVDFSFVYDFGEKSSVFLDELSLGFFVTNIFDEDPPFVDDIRSGVGFDVANGSPLGRFIAFEITKGF